MVVKVNNLYKQFGSQKIFENFNLEIKENEFVAIAGKSGCGKSTLLNMIGLLDTCDLGTINLFDNKPIKPYSKQAVFMLREKIGYLFQNFALIEHESVDYNLNMVFFKEKKEVRDELIKQALEQINITHLRYKKICECSGGEQQRVAIARLILKKCDLVLADEPTGSLDEENKQEIFKLLKKLQSMNKTIIVVTHDKDLMDFADRVIQ